MIKFIIGIVVGIVLVTYYPQITTTTTKLFIESGGLVTKLLINLMR